MSPGKTNNWLDTAKENESVFRTILDEYGYDHKDLSVYEIYVKYGIGVPQFSEILRIEDFCKVSDNSFEISVGRMSAPLAGRGNSILYTFKNGDIVNKVSGCLEVLL